MIVVDTSALMAMFLEEREAEKIGTAVISGGCAVPSVVILEFSVVASGNKARSAEDCDEFIETLLTLRRLQIVPLDITDVKFARDALSRYGKGRQNRAQLNIVDLMVYGIAKRLDAPILCTGRDFAETDARIHASSRLS